MARPWTPDSGDRRYGAVESADGELVCGGADAPAGQGPDLALPLTWIEQRLAECGWTSKELVQSENQQQAAAQVSMSNSIGSLRFLGAMDWRVFVETQSVVEQTLRQDPGGAYSKMDFATRDRYRHVIEEIAKSSRHSESQVASQAIRHRRSAPIVPHLCHLAAGRSIGGAVKLHMEIGKTQGREIARTGETVDPVEVFNDGNSPAGIRQAAFLD